MTHQYHRRKIVQGFLTFTALALTPLKLLARNKAAFAAEDANTAMAAIFADKPLAESEQIQLKLPDIAEDGSVVPVSVSTTLENVTSISLIVDNNPNPLSARFTFMPGAIPNISTRIKMGGSSVVRAAVETDSVVYVTQKTVKVTLGGCGG